MKIVIDARMYGLEHAGIGRYVANLIRELSHQPSIIDHRSFILLVRKKNLGEIKREFGNTFGIVVCEAPHYSFKEQILLPLQLIKLKPDLVHFPHFNVPLFWQGKYVVTIHDLIKHEFRGRMTTTRKALFYWLKYLGYKTVFEKAVKNALKIIVPSKTVKAKLIDTCKIPSEKVTVIYEGVAKTFKISPVSLKSQSKLLAKYKISKPFIVYTGNVYPHKNLERLLQAIKLINSPHFNRLNKVEKPISLVISCARSVFWQGLEKKIKESRIEKYVRLPGFVSDEQLGLLYQQASCFVFPTLSEGFGLPGLEAMSMGLPVVCSDIPILREVYGKAAIYFDPSDVNDIAQKIKEVCSYDSNHRNSLIEKGFRQTQKYSWEKMAKETLHVYFKNIDLSRKDLSKIRELCA